MVSIATDTLIDVLVSKQVFSYGQSQDVFKFVSWYGVSRNRNG